MPESLDRFYDDPYHFLSCFEESRFLFQTYADNNITQYPVLVLYGTLEEHIESLREAERNGQAVCFALQGCTYRKQVKYARLLFLDFDNIETLPDLICGKKPSIVVKTKSGFHVYFLIELAKDLNLWSQIQRGMVHHAGSDPGCVDKERVARLPGFLHQKDPNYPFRVHVPECPEFPNRIPIYRLEDFKAYKDKSEKSVSFDQYNGEPLLTVHRAWPFPLLLKILNTQLRKLRTAQVGERYITIQSVASCLGSYITVGLSFDFVREALFKAYSQSDQYSDRNRKKDFESIIKMLQLGWVRGKNDPPALPEQQRSLFEREDQQNLLLEQLASMPLGDQVAPREIFLSCDSWGRWFDSERAAVIRIGKVLKDLGYSEHRTAAQRVYRRRCAGHELVRASGHLEKVGFIL